MEGATEPTRSHESADQAGLAALRTLLRGVQLTGLIGAAATLGLADRIGAEPRPLEALAAETAAAPDRLERLLRALAAFGVFALDAERRVSHTALSRWLRTDSRPSLHHAARYWASPGTFAAWSAFAAALRGGPPPLVAATGESFFDYLAARPEEAAIFDAFMRESPDDRHAAVADALDTEGVRRVVDVGGGDGGLAAALLQANPGLEAVLLERGPVALRAAERLAGLGLASRCRIVPGDFFAAVPEGGDLYTLSQILHDWDDADAARILALCRAAMAPGGRVAVIERLLPPFGCERDDPAAFLADTHMLAILPGRERSRDDYAALFRRAGLASPDLVPTRSAFAILLAGSA